MKKLFAVLALTFLVVSQLFAQTDEAFVTGQIIDQQQRPVSSASVAVFDSTESHIVTGASSNSNGSFKIGLQPGSYVLRITYISYKTVTKPFEVSAGETKDFGTIMLESTSEKLGEVVVRAEVSHMEMSFDKRVFNVGQDITSMGGSALNVLNNVPSILTDIDGNISLRGNSSVRVLINGKPSNRVDNGNVSALRSIPASMIKRVEIITNPSAKYSAEGSAGIINIILKKKRDEGFNGSFNAGAGYPENYEIATNLNYRAGNINWFMGGSVDYRSDPEEGSSFQRFWSPDTSYMYREVSTAKESEVDADLRLGADFFLSENEILTASTSFEIEDGKQDQDVTYTDYIYNEGVIYSEPIPDNRVLRQTFRDEVENSEEQELGFNLEYENRIEGDAHKLTAEADFDISNQTEYTDITERVGIGDANPFLQRSRNSQESMDFRAEADYVRPLGEKGKLEAGARTSFDWMENSYLLEEQRNGDWRSVPAFNNNFIFNENVNSAYLIVGSEFGAFSAQVGLRLEDTHIYTKLKETGAENEQNYTNLFPSAFLNYSFNERQSIQFSYSRRLNRPWSRMLLPFTDYSDSRSRWTGNPNLSPEYSNSFEAGYLHYWGTGSLLTSFYYRHRTDVIDRVTILDEDGIRRRFPINLSTEDAWGVEFSADQEIMNGLTLTANANFYTAQSEGSYQGRLLTSDTETFQARMGIRWRISDLWNFQYSARYRAPRETTQGQRAAMTMMNTGIARELFDGKATISLSIRDLLNSRNYQSTITDDGIPNTILYSHREFRWSARSFSLNFTYHFGSNNSRDTNRNAGNWSD
ncbi:MAG TPA: TonB-dependent receptor [Balneolaceae bacterium]|nr:TonB-dependent receptor [Balneolaceae bacterium]